MVADWHLDMFAKMILQELWHDRKSSVKAALELVRQNYVPDSAPIAHIDEKMIRTQITKLEQKSEKLLELRLEDLITKEEFSAKKTALDKELAEFREQLADSKKADSADNNLDAAMANIENALEEYIDFSKIKVADEIVDQFVKQVTVYEGGRFKFLIDFSGSKNDDKTKTEVFLYERSVSFEEAYSYRKQYGFYIRKSQWPDVKLEVWTLI